ncbi:NF-kappa-B inhibitor epsilon-like isoform X2 [Petromyzon marinus]|uniref:NF-kappa-B inhibitor epsilon-like isoform X2 n=1 Tax=Petromyzon marinus TaxID=7757 RepID=A0AAJ7WP97_PETMA|nr:NF-kappa-B inhibitor epsilon-like isoform X2 [Petromyzon marinus]
MSVSRGDVQGQDSKAAPAPAADEACDSGIGSLCEADVESIRAGVSRLGVDGTPACAQLGTRHDDCRRGKETGPQPGTYPGSYLAAGVDSCGGTFSSTDSAVGSMCEADLQTELRRRAAVSGRDVDPREAERLADASTDFESKPGVCGFGCSAQLNDRWAAVIAAEADEDGDTFLHQAIIHGAPDIALHVLYKDVNRCLIDQQNYLMQTPLHLAVVTDEWRLARSLVLAGANMCLQDLRGNTPLHLACAQQSLEAVWALTDQLSPDEIPINTSSPIIVPSGMEILNYKGSTCLHVAVLNSNVKLVDYLVRKGANIEAKDPKSGRTPLHMAVEQGDGVMVARLVELGAQVNAIMYNGCTPLHQAVGRRLVDLAKLLMRLGADATLPNLEYDSPLDLADDHGMSLFAYDDFTIEGHLVKNTF